LTFVSAGSRQTECNFLSRTLDTIIQIFSTVISQFAGEVSGPLLLVDLKCAGQTDKKGGIPLYLERLLWILLGRFLTNTHRRLQFIPRRVKGLDYIIRLFRCFIAN
jgi:hypothetical protein